MAETIDSLKIASPTPVVFINGILCSWVSARQTVQLMKDDSVQVVEKGLLVARFDPVPSSGLWRLVPPATIVAGVAIASPWRLEKL